MFTILRNVERSVFRRHPSMVSCRCSSGYIVLVPEIGEQTDEILTEDGLPKFSTVTIENCLSIIGQQAEEVEKSVGTIESRIKSKENIDVCTDIFNEFEKVTSPLETTWGISKTLYLNNSTLVPTKSYLNIHDRAKKARASKFTNDTIYHAIQKHQPPAANTEVDRLSKKYLLEGKLNGLGLTPAARSDLNEIIHNLGLERAHFQNKTNSAIRQFSHLINNYNVVRDFPPSLIEATAANPTMANAGPWRITLQPRLVQLFLKHCPDRTERWNVWQADVRKCSGNAEKSLETSTHLEKIRALRKRQAQLLGYGSYAEMSMQTKMIKSLDNAKSLFSQLLRYAGPAQLTEIESLQTFASTYGFEHKLDLFDIAYWQRKRLLSEFDLQEESLREYFPLPRVMNGMFKLAETLFDIKIVERKNAEVWDADVKYYDIFDGSVLNEPLAGFYLDAYSKENRFSMNSGLSVGIRNRNVVANSTPLSALIFNFSEPLHGKPYLLSVDDLKIVFKTFGTTLQQLLTKSNYSDLAGLSNIEWDASQISAEVFVNFLDNEQTLKSISGHYANDEPIPAEVLKNIKLFKTNLAGHNLCQELYRSDLDLEFHHATDFWLDVVKRLWPVYNCLPLDKKYAQPCSWTDIFSGDWGAAYYSRLYSRVIAADIVEAFADEKSNINATGKRFRETFLAHGGSLCAEEVFRRFRGRDPSPEAFLKSLDLLKATETADF